jgi:hypothetical protein
MIENVAVVVVIALSAFFGIAAGYRIHKILEAIEDHTRKDREQ